MCEMLNIVDQSCKYVVDSFNVVFFSQQWVVWVIVAFGDSALTEDCVTSPSHFSLLHSHAHKKMYKQPPIAQTHIELLYTAYTHA